MPLLRGDIRRQIFPRQICDYLTKNPSAQGPDFIEVKRLDQFTYACHREENKLLVPQGIVVGIVDTNYEDLILKLDQQKDLKIFPRSISPLDASREHTNDELRSVTSALVFRRALPRSELKRVENIGQLPQIDEIVFFGIALDQNAPETRRLLIKLRSEESDQTADLLNQLSTIFKK